MLWKGHCHERAGDQQGRSSGRRWFQKTHSSSSFHGVGTLLPSIGTSCLWLRHQDPRQLWEVRDQKVPVPREPGEASDASVCRGGYWEKACNCMPTTTQFVAALSLKAFRLWSLSFFICKIYENITHGSGFKLRMLVECLWLCLHTVSYMYFIQKKKKAIILLLTVA